ncbi:MAG: type II toxin-antitoxin system Phd/YefM family antitoxin [Mycobacteriaceae bacterium]|uniref:type II toxin-antitoxin system Phd/YefM family antitoxin n=1 Tax=Corynebacterium sp. TaxID=1720 RepID=UPI003F990C7D
MSTVSKRELNQHTAATLNQVTDDDDVIITEHGKPRWRVTRYRAQETTLERLERQGLYTPPSGNPPPWPEDTGGPTYTSEEIDALIEDMKGDH